MEEPLNLKFSTISDLESEAEHWTHARFRDEFFLCLSKVPNIDLFYLDRKYYALANELTPRIPVYKPAPAFIFNISDLSQRCKDEFLQFVKLNSEKQVTLFLKEIAVKFFENINYNYTHNAVLPHLKVRLEN